MKNVEIAAPGLFQLVQRLSIGLTYWSVALPDLPAGDPAAFSVTPAKAGAHGEDGSQPSPGRQESMTAPFSHTLCKVNLETVR